MILRKREDIFMVNNLREVTNILYTLNPDFIEASQENRQNY